MRNWLSSHSSATDGKVRLVVVDSHPIQYHYQYYRLFGADPRFDQKVYFCWDTREGVEDPSYGKVRWDVPLLEGYKSEFVPNLAWRQGFHFSGQINPGLLRRLDPSSVDVAWIWGYSTASAWLAAITARLRGIPVLFRGEATLEAPRSKLRRLVKALLVRAFLRTVSAVAYSCSANRRYYEHYGVAHQNLVFAPCAVDNAFFQEAGRNADRHSCRHKLGLSDEDRVILFVGRLIDVKRPLDLLQVLRQLPPELNPVLLLVGDGPLREEMSAYCRKYGLDRVRYCGFVNQSDLAAYYQAADVFVLASEVDQSPKALNEAMAFGLPVVVTDRIGTGEDLVFEGRNGFIVPCGDVDRLAACLSEILTDPVKATALGVESRKIIESWTFEKGYAAIRSWLLDRRCQ